MRSLLLRTVLSTRPRACKLLPFRRISPPARLATTRPLTLEQLAAVTAASSIATSTSPVNTGYPLADALPDDSQPTESSATSPAQLRTPDTTMASDSDYTAFLERANEPSSAAAQTSAPSSGAGTQSLAAAAPAALVHAAKDRFYTSESDEEFTALAFPCAVLDERAVAAAAASAHESEVQELSVRDFDPRGEYADLVRRVGEVSGGAARVFRVQQGRSGCEYWIVAQQEERAVGVKVKAVET